MGETGMAEMSEMPMPLPENTLPMMAGEGPYGALEMGGMKVRDDLPVGDYGDPGWYRAPAGTVAWLLEDGESAPPANTAPSVPGAGKADAGTRPAGAQAAQTPALAPL